MNALDHFMPQVWFAIIGLFLFLYVMLDGFDLGVGILSLTSSTEESRGILMTSLGNIWDANETWLVVTAGALFGAFPLAYGTLLQALYIPIMVMLFGFIFRAVAFEFREHSDRKIFWNTAFGAGSFLAALGQGFSAGAILAGIKVDVSGHFIGSTWDWLNWQSLFVALTLIQGYVLIGSTYLILKTEGELQIVHYRTAKIAAWTTLAGTIGIAIITPIFFESLRDKLFQPPLLYVFALIPIIGVALIWALLQSLDQTARTRAICMDDFAICIDFPGLGFNHLSLCYPYSDHDLPSRSFAECVSIYDCVHRGVDPDYVVLQHLPVHCVPREGGD